MNNNYINNEIISLQHFRLRSERRKKRAQHEDKDKQLLAIHKEENNLWYQRRNLGWIELHPPVMRGYKRYFVLRSDVAKTNQAAFFEGILQKINTTDYSYRKDFKVKKRKWGKKIYVVKEQYLSQPGKLCFDRLNFTEAEKSYFEEREIPTSWGIGMQRVFVFRESWRFVLRVRPNIITKTRVRDEVIESRIQQIRNYIQRNALRGRLNHLTDGHTYSWWEGEKYKQKNHLKNKSFTAILEEFYVKDKY